MSLITSSRAHYLRPLSLPYTWRSSHTRLWKVLCRIEIKEFEIPRGMTRHSI